MWSCWPARAGPLRSATRLQHRMYTCWNVCAVQIRVYTIAADYNGPVKHVNAHTDDDRYDMVGCGAFPRWTSQISYETAASHVRM